jgi:hypothetical protein
MSLINYGYSNIGMYFMDDGGKPSKRALFNGNPDDEVRTDFTLQDLIDFIPDYSILFTENSAFGYQLKDRNYFIDQMKKKNVTVYATAQRSTPYLPKVIPDKFKNIDYGTAGKSDVIDTYRIAFGHVDIYGAQKYAAENPDCDRNEFKKFINIRACRLFTERGTSFYDDDTVGYDRNQAKLELISARLDKYVNEKKMLADIMNKHKFESEIFNVYGAKGKVNKTELKTLILQVFAKARFLFASGVFSREAMKRELGFNAHGQGNQIRASLMNTTNGKLFTMMKSIIKKNGEYETLTGDAGAVPVPSIEADNGELIYDLDTVLRRYRAGEPLVLNDKRKAYIRDHCENIQFRRSVRNNIIRDINRFYGYLKGVYRTNPELFRINEGDHPFTP